MSFTDYLASLGVNDQTEGTEGIVYKIMLAYVGKEDYRYLSLFFADIPELSDKFESLWSEYENQLDRTQYENDKRS